jgi:chemotaxis receptor (MCP) glutamine deamidase CheD
MRYPILKTLSNLFIGPALALIAASSAHAFTSRPAITVDMAGTKVASAAEASEIRTYGVAACVVLTFYDPISRTGALSHVWSYTDIASLVREVEAEFARRGLAGHRLEVRLFGGWKGWSETLVERIVQRLRGENVDIVALDVLAQGPVRGTYELPEHLEHRMIRNASLELETGELQELP